MAVSAPAKPALQTAEDLERLSAQGFRYELIKGELHERAFAGGLQGSIASRLFFYVGSIIIPENLGMTFAAGTGFLVERNPDTVLAPDFAFVAEGRLPNPLPDGYVALVPDIVLQTRSPNDTRQEVADKVAQWLELGVRLVWELNPQTRILTVHGAGQPPQVLGENDTLDGGDVLPGLSVPIARLFL